MMPILTPDMYDVIQRAMLSFVATVNEDGTPNLSPKASLFASNEALFFADIASPRTIENLRRNPAISINVVDVFSRRGYRFSGLARLLTDADPDRKSVTEWVWRTNGPDYPVHHVVRIDVREALPLLSPAYRFGEATSEDVLREVYMAKYGVRKRDRSAPQQHVDEAPVADRRARTET
jgi:predicted pyridoxine 5'-phosphate oxidase superfamily flavin-nucleotide-binding protein